MGLHQSIDKVIWGWPWLILFGACDPIEGLKWGIKCR